MRDWKEWLLKIAAGLVIAACAVSIAAGIYATVRYWNTPASEIPGWAWWLIRG